MRAASSRTLRGDAWYRLRRNRLAALALVWIAIIVIVTLSADLWVPQHFGNPAVVDSVTAP